MEVKPEYEVELKPGENVRVPRDFRAIVKFYKLEITPLEICEKLISLDPEEIRKGDFKELQHYAKLAIRDEAGLDLKNGEHEGRTEQDSPGLDRHQGGAGYVES